MKQYFTFALLVVMTGCTDNSNIMVNNSDGADSGIYYSYSPVYSTLAKGNYAYLKTVTDIWKEYENGDILNTSDLFAQNVVLVFPEYIYAGTKEKVLNQYKDHREKLGTVQSFISMWMPVYAKDRDQQWVFIWGRQENTDTLGKKGRIDLHETWRFNKDGKVAYMRQYHTRRY